MAELQQVKRYAAVLAQMRRFVAELEALAKLAETRRSKTRVDVSGDDYRRLCQLARVDPDEVGDVVSLPGAAYATLCETAVERAAAQVVEKLEQ